MIKKTLFAAVVLVILLSAAVGCAAEVNTVQEETPSAIMVVLKTAAPATPSPTPIKTTQPEPQPTPIAVITVKEGDTLERDILPKLTQAFDLSEDDIKQALSQCPDSILINTELTDFRRMEGIILPGEYQIYQEDTLEDLIISWVKQAEQRYENIDAQVEDQNELEPYERLTLASIIEWECIANEHYYETAAVFLNRLDKGMKLQSCVTSEYAIGFQRPFLYTADTKVESPYNTYYIKGLPIGPICNPDDDSIKAASSASVDDSLVFFFYNYVDDEMFFFAEYADFKREGRASRELFESEFTLDPHEVIDKREIFG